ncbi:MAG: hypothetical protein O7H41_18355 [Planctomycetota bacterium]|nr:hypothetical protein [Planctomycetota bacterium]
MAKGKPSMDRKRGRVIRAADAVVKEWRLAAEPIDVEEPYFDTGSESLNKALDQLREGLDDA